MARYVKVDDGPPLWLWIAIMIAVGMAIGVYALIVLPLAYAVWVYRKLRQGTTIGELVGKPLALIAFAALYGGLRAMF